MSAAELSQRVEKVWDLRNRDLFDESYEEYLDLCIECGVQPSLDLESQIELLRKSLDPEVLVDFLLLEVSYLRRRKKMDEARSRLTRISEFAKSERISKHFQLSFQTGLNALDKAQISTALDSFIVSKKVARNAAEFHYSAFNAILCLEDLGYPFERPLAEFEESFRDQQDEQWVAGARNEYRGLQLREAFRKGEFDQLEAYLAEMRGSGNVVDYECGLIESLPYVSRHKVETNTEGLLENTSGYHTRYRARTLHGLLVQDDLSAEVRPSDRVHRIYLWTWRWLESPNVVLLGKILQVLEAALPNGASELPVNDYLMLENALRWLGLFAGLKTSHIRQKILAKCSGVTPGASILDFEKSLIDYFYAVFDRNDAVAEDTLEELRRNELYTNSVGGLSKLLDAFVSGDPVAWDRLGGLTSSLHDLLIQPQVSEGLVVDSVSSEVELFRKGSRDISLVSQNLSRLISSFGARETIDVFTLMKNVYGISYSDEYHSQKIASLLSRANRVLKDSVRFARRGDTIYAEFAEQPKLVRNNDHTSMILDIHFSSRLFGVDGPARKEGVDSAKLTAIGPDDWLTRKQLEDAFNMTRSTLLRRVSDWAKKGLVQKRGQGKSSRYKLESPLIEDFLNGRFH